MKARLEDAILLAACGHRGQKDKAGAPYILHPLRLMMRLETDAQRMAAVLHDVVEDCAVTLKDLAEAGFPARVVKAVDALTRREGESYEAFVLRAGRDPVARRVKLADLEDNMDLRRIAKPGPKDLARLEKYRKAWASLRGPRRAPARRRTARCRTGC